MKNVFKLVAQAILSKEFAELNKRQRELENNAIQLQGEKTRLENEVSALTRRIIEGHQTLLPHKVISALITMLPDPNAVGSGRFRPDLCKKSMNVQCQACSFEIRFAVDQKILNATAKAGVTFEIKNEFGRMNVFIPVEKSNYHNSVTQIETYTWSIYQSGLVGVTDELFSIIFSSTQAWAECLNELFL